MNILTIIQARVGSTRLPGKILLPVLDEPLLIRMIERVSMSKHKGIIVVAMSTDQEDDIIKILCTEKKLLCFRGSPDDLLDRHYQAAAKYKPDAVVKIPSDCPLIDPAIIDKIIEFYLKHFNKYDYVSNLHPATYPDGNDVEIMSFVALKEAWQNAKLNFEREHTTPFIWENPDKFRIGNVTWETGQDFSMSHRFTIDYPEDYKFIRRVYEELYTEIPDFTLQDILYLLKEKPQIYKLNKKYAGVNWYRNHLDQLKTINKNQTRSIT